MGRRHLQLWISLLGPPRQLPHPTAPRSEIHRLYDPPLVSSTSLPRRGEELRWHSGAPLSPRHVRSQHQSGNHEHRVNVLYPFGATAPNVHLPRLQRHGNHGWRSARLRPRPRPQPQPQDLAAYLPSHRAAELRLGLGVPVGDAGLACHGQVLDAQAAHCGD